MFNQAETEKKQQHRTFRQQDDINTTPRGHAYTVRTNARPAADINCHSWRALAEKGAWGVDALAIDTQSGKHLTLVHI